MVGGELGSAETSGEGVYLSVADEVKFGRGAGGVGLMFAVGAPFTSWLSDVSFGMLSSTLLVAAALLSPQLSCCMHQISM